MKLRLKLSVLRVSVLRERRRQPVDEPVAALHRVAPLQPHQAVLDLVVDLLRIDRQERRAARDAGEVGDVDVRQARS